MVSLTSGPVEHKDSAILSTHVVSITPFTEDGTPDLAAYRSHLERLASAGVGIYVCGGGTGEGYTLDRDEQFEHMRTAVEAVGSRTSVRAMGVEPRTAAEMSDFVQLAERAGVHAVQIYSLDVGHGHRPTNAELEAYLFEVLEGCAIPTVLSSHFSVGYSIPVTVLKHVVERHPSVIGINCTQPDLHYLAAVVEAFVPRVAVHVGGPDHALTAIGLGASGFLSSEGNLAPRLASRLIDGASSNDLASAGDAYRSMLQLAAVLRSNGGLRATKAALRRFGLAGGYPRPPRHPLATEQAEQVMSALARLSIEDFL